jgi:signal transduction histidine kinase
VVQFAAGGLLAVLVISLAVVLILRSYARDQAVRNARDIAVAEARAGVVPDLTDELVRGEPTALANLDGTVRGRLLNYRVVRIKVWDATGRIVYSDEPRLIGSRFPLAEDEQTALRTGMSHAEVSDLSRPENTFERSYRKLLEVYVGQRTPGGTPLLFEAYLRYQSVASEQARVLGPIVPALVGGLILLFLVQIPLAWSMAKRTREGQRERERLLERAIQAGEHERHRIAADLHDAVVQNLAGTAFALAGAADRVKKHGLDAEAATVRLGAAQLRQGVRDLRTLIVTMASPRLHQEGLSAALRDLLSPLVAQGMHADFSDTDLPLLPEETERLIFRTAQEAVRNVVAHAGATNVSLEVGRDNGGPVVLTVYDDGRGFQPAEARRRREEGHLGMALLGELAIDAGAALTIDSQPGQGTTVRLEVPVS